MKKALIAVAAAAALLFSILAPGTAEAQGRTGRQILRAVGVGLGVAAGMAIFGAAARAHLDPRYHSYAPIEGYYYVDRPYYVTPPVACPGGFWAYRVNRRGEPRGPARWMCPPPGYYASHYYWR